MAQPKNNFSVISVGYGRHLFNAGNDERLRMEACAEAVGEYHAVVFIRPEDNLEVVKGNSGLVLHPVTSSIAFLKIFKAIRVVRKIIKESDQTVVVTTQDPFEAGLVGYLATRFTRAKLNVQEHADVYSTHHWKQESFLNHFRYYFGLFLLRQADSVRVVAKRITETLVSKGVARGKIKQLAVLTNADRFRNATVNEEVFEVFSQNHFIFLTIARLVPQKNLPLLIRAFFEAHRVCPNIRLIIAGKGQEEELLQTLIQQNNQTGQSSVIKIIPWIDDVPGYMKAVDSYVLSSNYEGWGRVLIEAKIAGLPIVTTDVGCVNEEVITGKHGLVVPVNDHASLSQAIISMAKDEEQYRTYKTHLASKQTIKDLSYVEYAKQWAEVLAH